MFAVQCDEVQETAELFLERGHFSDVSVNGSLVTLNDDRWWIDKSIIGSDIKNLLVKGRNEISVVGTLKAANMKKEARDLAKKTVKLLGQDVLEHNNMSESYNPETGKPTMEGSFLNWNVLVIEMMRDLSE